MMMLCSARGHVILLYLFFVECKGHHHLVGVALVSYFVSPFVAAVTDAVSSKNTELYFLTFSSSFIDDFVCLFQ